MTTFKVEGMTCGGCVASVTRALLQRGMKAEVSLATHTVDIAGEPDEVSVRTAIEAAGFDFGGRVGAPRAGEQAHA